MCLVVGGSCECVFHFVVMVSTVYVLRKSCALRALRRLVLFPRHKTPKKPW